LHFSWTIEQDSEEEKGIECLICFSWEWMVTLQDICKYEIRVCEYVNSLKLFCYFIWCLL
jgi:hypothetical protein